MPISPAIRKPQTGGRPPREVAEQLAVRVIACASRLFMERGYAGVSIEAVAAEAGVGKNTIYRRYATKSDLFQAVIDDQIRTQLREPDETVSGNLEGGLRQLAVTLVQTALNPEVTAFQRLVIAEAERFPEIAVICLDRAFRPAIAMARAVLAQSAGPQSTEAELDFAAEQFVAAVVYGPHLHALMGRHDLKTSAEVERYADRAVTLFLGGRR